MDSPAVPARLIGAIFVERGLVTQEALDEALAEQAETGQLLGEILVARFGVSRLELASAIAEQWAELERGGEPGEPEAPTGDGEGLSDPAAEAVPIRLIEVGERRPLGEIFVEQGMITEDELAAALRRQGETGERLGEILVAQGAISRLELASALADQWANLQKLRPPEPSWPNGQGAESAEDALAVSAEIDSVRQALADAEARLQGAVDEIEAARAEGARRLAELAGEMPPLAAEVEALRHRADQLESIGQEALAGALDDVRGRLDELGEHVRQMTARATVDPEQVEALAGRLSAVEGRTDADLRELVQALSVRLDEIASRPHVDAWAVDVLGQRLDALEERVREAVERPNIDPAFADEVRTRLGQLEGRDDAELRGLLEALSGRVDELAGRPVVESSTLDELRARLTELEARDASDLRGDVEALSRRLDEIASRPAPDLSAVDALSARLDELASRPQLDTAAIESLRDQLWALEEHVRDVADRPGTHPALDDVRARLDALSERDDSELHGRIDDLSSRLHELAGQPDADLSALEGLSARLNELERRDDGELRGRMEELSRDLEELAGRPSADFSALDSLWGRLEQLEGRPSVDAAQIDELASRLAAVESRQDDGLRSRVEELGGQIGVVTDRLLAVEQRDEGGLEARVDSLAGQLDALTGRRDEDLLAWVDTVQSRVASLEDRPVPDPALSERLDELARLQSEGLAALSERIADAVRSVAAQAEGVQAAGGETRATLDDAVGRVAELERVLVQRVDDVERHVAHLRERVDDDEASVALWRAVDGLRGRAGQTLSLLGQLGAQLEELKSQVKASTEHDSESVADPASTAPEATPTAEPDPALGHVRFVHAADGYGLVPCAGPAPVVGSRLELEGGEDAVVVRVGRSPLPGDERPCVYVERAVAT